MRTLCILLPAFLLACVPDKTPRDSGAGDGDGDGFSGDLDCDDGDASVNPDAEEVCDGVDNDCSGEIDDDATDASEWVIDTDGDGFGAEGGVTAWACDQPSGYADNSTDCNDGNPSVNTDGEEVCDRADNDCDGVIDEEDASDAVAWYPDADRDGYGDSADEGYLACDGDLYEVDNADDCDDADPAVNPEGVETWYDGADTDCDGRSDYDADGDGFDSSAHGGDDCDDLDATTSPAAVETWYDGIDTNCDGGSDYDADGDGHDSDAFDGDDCDDTTADVSPSAGETWYDGVDSDCDGASDYDADGDGSDSDDHGGRDCDDSDSSIGPLGTEVCNDVDDDCDGLVDDADSSLSAPWYIDLDGDGYGDEETRYDSCDDPEGYIEDGTDCDDGDEAVHPGADEVEDDGIDSDCDGYDSHTDSDGDGWYGGDDCDDDDATVHPYAYEDDSDGIDNDCDGDIDTDDIDPVEVYTMTDDDSELFSFASLSFPFCDDLFTEVYVNSNGTLNFERSFTSYSESTSSFTSAGAMVMAYWDDLYPPTAGSVEAIDYGDAVGVYWVGVPEISTSTPNTFGAVLFDDGRIYLEYGDMSSVDAIVGWSCADSSDMYAVDLSDEWATGPAEDALGIGMGTETAYYEQFTTRSPNDLGNSALMLCGDYGTDADGDGYTDACGDPDDADADVTP